MAVLYFVVKEGVYSVTCLSADEFPINPPDNCDLFVTNNGKTFKSNNGTWIPAVPVVLQNNRWVDVIGNDNLDTADGTIVNPFISIQQAIDSINNASALNPYIINIGTGVFVGDITVKNGISLIGLDKSVADTTMNLTVLSGNVTFNTATNSTCNFSNITFKGSENTISFSGNNETSSCNSHFYGCKIHSNFSARTYSYIVFNDVNFLNTDKNISFSDNSTFTFIKGVLSRGIDVDYTSTLRLFGYSIFNKQLSNIDGTILYPNIIENFSYNNTLSGLLATNPQDAIDELTTMINSGGTSNPIHHTDNFSENTTYVGFGTTGATSIMKIISYSGNTYDTLWAEGNKIKDKNWDNRYEYFYSEIV